MAAQEHKAAECDSGCDRNGFGGIQILETGARSSGLESSR
jgi:hypothetical protein